MLADALPQLPLLCKLDLSYNSLTSYGLEPLASALLARNRNALGAAAENRLNMQVYGNRISEELETRIQSLSVPTSMTHAADRMPSVKHYGAPPPSRGEMGNGGRGFAGLSSPYDTSGYGGGSRGSASSSARSGGACNGLPAPPTLVPSPVLVRAPVPRPSLPQPAPPKGPRCASSPPRGASMPASAGASAPSHPGMAAAAAAAAAAPQDPSRPLGSGKPTLLTAIPPPLPARRGSAPSEEGAGSVYGAVADSLDFPLRLNFTSTSKLTKIYGAASSASPPLSPSGAGGGGLMMDSGRRGSPGRPLSSPAPALRALPMALSQMRAIVPGAPYAAALVNAGNNPLLNGNRNRPTAGSTCSSGGGSDWYSGAGGAASLPMVRKSYPAADVRDSGSGSSEAENGGNDNADCENGSGSGGGGGGKGGKPKLSGASDHLMLRTKCHTPDWVNRMQEDFYKKITAPRPPQQPPPPPGPPPEHLFRKLLCHDSEWQRAKQMEQMLRECAPEPKPQPVPGAPLSNHMVSSVALIQRGGGGGSGGGSGGGGGSTGPRSGGGGARLSPRPSALASSDVKPVAAEVSPDQDWISPEPQHPDQPEHPVKPEAEADAPAEVEAASVKSPRGSTAATGGEAQSGAAAEGNGEPQPAPAPPGPPIRTAGASGNLGSEESMEVLAVRNTGRKKAAIEVLRIKKGSGAAGASGDGCASGEGDEDEDGDGDDDGDGAQTEASRVYGIGDGDGDGDGPSGGSSRRGGDGGDGGTQADGEEGAGSLVQLSSEAVDLEQGRTYADEETAAAATAGNSNRNGAEHEYNSPGGPQGGASANSEGGGHDAAGSSRRSGRSRSSSSSGGEDLGAMQVRGGDAAAEEEVEAARAAAVAAGRADEDRAQEDGGEELSLPQQQQQQQQHLQENQDGEGGISDIGPGYYGGDGALSPVGSAALS